MTKAPTPTEMSKGQSDNTNNATKSSIKQQYAISQLRFVRSGLHLVTYLDVGNFCDKRTKKILNEICVQGFLRFSNSNKQSQSVSLIYELV